MYKELDKLVVKAKKGDKESKEEILNRLEGLVINSIKKYYNNVHEYDDLIQEGNMVILESIASYDKRKGVYFLGYIKTMLRYSYLNNHKKRQHLSLNVEAKDGEGDELLNLLESEEASPLDEYLDLEEQSGLNHILGRLTDRQRQVIIYFYYENMSIGDIAKRLGITYRTVVNTKTRAIERIREYNKNY